jgi:hypothetical protein
MTKVHKDEPLKFKVCSVLFEKKKKEKYRELKE